MILVPAPVTGCDLLRSLSARTWSDVRDGAYADVVVGEESITDYLLLDLHRHARGLAYLQKWSRHQEGRRTGADWDWWFVRPDLSAGVGLRIQAKRLDFFTQRFEHFDHRNRTGRQIDMLEGSARAAGMHALYCLYLATEASPDDRTACLSYAPDDPRRDWPGAPMSLYGCSLIATGAVRPQLDAGDHRLAPLWPDLLPLSCLTCCEGWGPDLLSRVDAAAGALAARVPNGTGDDGADVPRSLITAELPPEVVAMVRSEGTERVLGPPDVGATLVTIVDDRPHDDE